MLRTVVFDLDDTLFAESEYVLSGFRAVDMWLATSHDVTGFLEISSSLLSAGLRGRIFDEALLRLAVPSSPAFVAELVRIYREHAPQLRLLPDAEVALDWVGAHCRMALLSDGYLEVQKRKLHALGIASRFQCIVFTDALGREFWKPHPAGFSQIMHFLPGPSSSFVYIGDNPRKDFIAPRSLGWLTVRIRRDRGEHCAYEPTPAEAADIEITSLTELTRVMPPVG